MAQIPVVHREILERLLGRAGYGMMIGDVRLGIRRKTKGGVSLILEIFKLILVDEMKRKTAKEILTDSFQELAAGKHNLSYGKRAKKVERQNPATEYDRLARS